MAEPTVMLVPGGFTGAWMWSDVVELLRKEGIAAHAIELPSIGDASHGADFYADAQAVRDALDRLESSVLLCGHSYGGAVITEAAYGPHPAVSCLVYLAAAVPDAGDSLASLMSATQESGNAEQEALTIRDDGLAVLDRGAALEALFNDCDADRATEALDRLEPSNVSAVGTQPLSGAAWRQLPATYVRGTEDPMPEAVSPGFVHRAEVVEIPTGHCPHWSRPDLVASLLADRVTGLSGEIRLQLTRVLPAPRTAVYGAFADAGELRKWWGPAGFSVPGLEFEPRVGQPYRIHMRTPEGDPFDLVGEFREVEPPARLAFTFVWEDPDPDDVEMLATLSFRDLGESTEVALQQGPFKTEARRALHRDGWSDSLDKLERLMA